jgi:AIPR protein
MSKVHVNHIKTALDRLFETKIDMADYAKKPETEKVKAFHSRALAAYSLHINASATIDASADAVVDTFDDNGIDAIYHDETQNTLYLVQSKFIEEGTGEPDTGELRKFKDGIIDLIEEKIERFNSKVQNKVQVIKDAFGNSQIKLNIILAYTGKGFSTHNQNIINDLINELNESTEWAYFTDFNLKSAHSTLNTVLAGKPIDSEISLSNWGAIDEPYPTYYGQISAFDLAQLWKNYRKNLFIDNIRNFIGMSEINSGILKTIESEPENFIYFNNGVTALCNEVNPLPAKTVGKTTGLFDCKGISIINGAQTVGSLGIAADKTPNQLKKCKLFIRLIPLNKCPENFGNKITIASNTQNKIEKRDFVSLDLLQQNLRTELLLQNINYHYKRTDEVIPYDESNCTLEEATVALACYQDEPSYSVTAKREIGKLWEDISKPPYKTLFNDNLKVHVLWRVIIVYRAVAKYLNESKTKEKDRKRAVCVFGNYFILHIVLQNVPKDILLNPTSNFTKYVAEELQILITNAVNKVFEISEQEYPTALMHQLFRNYSKCSNIKSKTILSTDKSTEVTDSD